MAKVDLGFEVKKSMAGKKDGQNGWIDPNVQGLIVDAAIRYNLEIHSMTEALSAAYSQFWREWRALGG